jgi:hypothetical protein
MVEGWAEGHFRAFVLFATLLFLRAVSAPKNGMPPPIGGGVNPPPGGP